MSRRDIVQQAFERFGREAGLQKHSGAWYRRSDEVVAVSDLQKSQYGPQYYVNQGFWVRQLGDEPHPKPAKAHIVVRLEVLIPSERTRIAQLLDLEEALPDELRFNELVALLKERVLPVIGRGSSIQGLRAMVEDGTLKGAAIRGRAHQLLGLPGASASPGGHGS